MSHIWTQVLEVHTCTNYSLGPHCLGEQCSQSMLRPCLTSRRPPNLPLTNQDFWISIKNFYNFLYFNYGGTETKNHRSISKSGGYVFQSLSQVKSGVAFRNTPSMWTLGACNCLPFKCAAVFGYLPLI